MDTFHKSGYDLHSSLGKAERDDKAKATRVQENKEFAFLNAFYRLSISQSTLHSIN